MDKVHNENAGIMSTTQQIEILNDKVNELQEQMEWLYWYKTFRGRWERLKNLPFKIYVWLTGGNDIDS